jgi:demethylmenaquinone methyltransferase/2-methoxy-6-polyprenyl-1,4-benzoquinol methylase
MFKHQAEKKAFVQQKFSSVSDKYDLLNSILSLGIDRIWRNRTTDELRDETKDGLILDLCAGTLPLSRVIYQRLKRRVIALDFCYDMLAYGQRRLRFKEEEAIVAICGDAEALPFEDNVFDAATVAFGVRNLGNIQKGIKELHRVLRPNGKLAILEFSRPSNPVFAPIYRFYLHKILPVTGGLISKDKAAYTYLAQSIEAFMPPHELCNLLKACGFYGVTYRPMTLGIVTLYTGKKHE